MSEWASESIGNEDRDRRVEVTFVGGPFDGRKQVMWHTMSIMAISVDGEQTIGGRNYMRVSTHEYRSESALDRRDAVVRWQGVVDRSYRSPNMDGSVEVHHVDGWIE